MELRLCCRSQGRSCSETLVDGLAKIQAARSSLFTLFSFFNRMKPHSASPLSLLPRCQDFCPRNGLGHSQRTPVCRPQATTPLSLTNNNSPATSHEQWRASNVFVTIGHRISQMLVVVRKASLDCGLHRSLSVENPLPSMGADGSQTKNWKGVTVANGRREELLAKSPVTGVFRRSQWDC